MRPAARLTLAIGALCCALAQASPLPDYPFVTADGKAERWLPPDVAQLQFDVGAQDQQAPTAAGTVTQTSDVVLRLLADNGVAAEDIDSYEVTKKAVFVGTRQSDASSLAYNLGRHFSVRVRDLSHWAPLVSALMEMDHVDSLDVAFDRSDRDAINADLLKDAATDARNSAHALADSFGRRLDKPVAITQGELAAVAVPFGLADRKSMTPRPAPRAPGDYGVPIALRFAQAVHAVFKLR